MQTESVFGRTKFHIVTTVRWISNCFRCSDQLTVLSVKICSSKISFYYQAKRQHSQWSPHLGFGSAEFHNFTHNNDFTILHITNCVCPTDDGFQHTVFCLFFCRTATRDFLYYRLPTLLAKMYGIKLRCESLSSRFPLISSDTSPKTELHRCRRYCLQTLLFWLSRRCLFSSATCTDSFHRLRDRELLSTLSIFARFTIHGFFARRWSCFVTAENLLVRKLFGQTMIFVFACNSRNIHSTDEDDAHHG